MKRSTYLIALAALFTFATANVFAQTTVQVDPGVSVNNYKHPNKAKKAKELSAETNTVTVPNIGTVEKVTAARERSRVKHAPKYASRPATLVLPGAGVEKGVQTNPLSSPRHYKTQTPAGAVSGNNTQVAQNRANADTTTVTVQEATID